MTLPSLSSSQPSCQGDAAAVLGWKGKAACWAWSQKMQCVFSAFRDASHGTAAPDDFGRLQYAVSPHPGASPFPGEPRMRTRVSLSLPLSPIVGATRH